MFSPKSFRKALGAMLLLAVFAVLFQGILHEFFHEPETHIYFSTYTNLCNEDEHEEGCHSHHKACSSLSCSLGAVFLTGNTFRWESYGENETFSLIAQSFRLPIIAVSLFKPPRTFVS